MTRTTAGQRSNCCQTKVDSDQDGIFCVNCNSTLDPITLSPSTEDTMSNATATPAPATVAAAEVPATVTETVDAPKAPKARAKAAKPAAKAAAKPAAPKAKATSKAAPKATAKPAAPKAAKPAPKAEVPEDVAPVEIFALRVGTEYVVGLNKEYVYLDTQRKAAKTFTTPARARAWAIRAGETVIEGKPVEIVTIRNGRALPKTQKVVQED